MTNIDRVEIFRTLADTDEYLAIAEEMGHIVALVDTWNQSLDDACRMRAKKVLSPLLSDFLERLAYSIGAGQQISDFLIEEQDTMIQNFATRYESDLAKLDVMKELFMSMMMAVSFLLSFAIILLVLTGINPMMPVMGLSGCSSSPKPGSCTAFTHPRRVTRYGSIQNDAYLAIVASSSLRVPLSCPHPDYVNP